MGEERAGGWAVQDGDGGGERGEGENQGPLCARRILDELRGVITSSIEVFCGVGSQLKRAMGVGEGGGRG